MVNSLSWPFPGSTLLLASEGHLHNPEHNTSKIDQQPPKYDEVIYWFLPLHRQLTDPREMCSGCFIFKLVTIILVDCNILFWCIIWPAYFIGRCYLTVLASDKRWVQSHDDSGLRILSIGFFNLPGGNWSFVDWKLQDYYFPDNWEGSFVVFDLLLSCLATQWGLHSAQHLWHTSHLGSLM